MASSIEEIMEALRRGCGEDATSSPGLTSAVSGVTKALSDLLKHMKKGPGHGKVVMIE